MALAPVRGPVPVPGRGQVREPGPALAVAPVEAERALVLSVAPELVVVRWVAPARAPTLERSVVLERAPMSGRSVAPAQEAA
jgi:hypothetical protein